MCIFGGDIAAIEHVSETRIFARAIVGRQILVYSMRVAARSPVAMILPLPVAAGSDESRFRFIDLKGYDDFFDDLDRAFPAPVEMSVSGAFGANPVASRAAPLPVHEVGDFVASFVPTRADFDRLDRRFRLSDAVWSALPHYADHGFAVFQLKDLGASSGFFGWLRRSTDHAPRAIHPMAFEFERRDPERLFFPTVHVHDGQVHETAVFDHALYAQFEPRRGPGDQYWQQSDGPLTHRVDALRANGTVDATLHCYKRTIRGRSRNEDVTVVERT